MKVFVQFSAVSQGMNSAAGGIWTRDRVNANCSATKTSTNPFTTCLG